MSRGPGRIEQRIIALFAAATDRSFSVAELCDHAYELGGKTATRAQRLSATRAAHNLIGGLAEATRQCREALDRVIAEATVKLGRRPSGNHHTYFSNGVGWRGVDEKFAEIMQTSPGQQQYSAAHKALRRQMDRWGAAKHASWCATEMPDRRIRFHPADYPVRVWAVAIRPGGVVWAEAEIIRITERNVMVR